MMFKNFLNNKNIPYITIPLAVIAFVFLSIIILNFTGVTGLVSNLFFAYINQDIPSKFTFNTGYVAGVSNEGNDLIARTCWDPVKGYCYPRRGVFHFGAPAPAEWYAKFDLVIIRSKSTSLVNEIKAINPSTYITSTLDWNAGAGLDSKTHDEWIVRTSTGEKIGIYSATNVFTFNFSDYCPTLVKYDNKKYNEYLPEYLISVHGLSSFDGITTDGLWWTPREAKSRYGDIDLDRTGVNDYIEHGEGWVNNKWQEGINKVFTRLWELMPENKFLIINSGILHDFHIPNSNGSINENAGPMYSWNYGRGQLDKWYNQSKTPHVLFWDGKGRHKKDYKMMRWILATSAYSDAYAGFSEEGLHNYDSYYDEYDLNLGYPIGSMQQLTDTKNNGSGVWVRFFDSGAVIMNMDSQPATITDADLQTLNYYDGPYYRFKGGQDPVFNNGQEFQSVYLDGKIIDVNKNGYVGDAILLVTTLTTAVTDIFLDSDKVGTSPGSEDPEYDGNWSHTNDVSNAWALSYRGYRGAYAISYSPAGDGSSAAKFTPTIGVSGQYKVYEWHGSVDNKQSASNVPYEIRHAGGTETGTINQRNNIGKWNYLGEFNFNKGTSGNVKISTDGTNGIVIADAIRFVYQGNHGNIKGPSAPLETCSDQSGSICSQGEYCDVPYLSAGDTQKCCPANHCLGKTADFDCDNIIGFKDFTIMIAWWDSKWNPNDYQQTIYYRNCSSILMSQSHDHIPDLNQDDRVNVSDLGLLLGQWGR